jgi:hypothetical protein
LLLHANCTRAEGVQDVEWHSCPIVDWYTPTLTLSVASFIYCAFFCQKVIMDNSSIDVLRTGRTLPAADLFVLVVLFVNMTLDRMCYSIGSSCSKALLLLVEVPLYFIGSWLLCWNNASSASDRFHLKVLSPVASSRTAARLPEYRTDESEICTWCMP